MAVTPLTNWMNKCSPIKPIDCSVCYTMEGDVVSDKINDGCFLLDVWNLWTPRTKIHSPPPPPPPRRKWKCCSVWGTILTGGEVINTSLIKDVFHPPAPRLPLIKLLILWSNLLHLLILLLMRRRTLWLVDVTTHRFLSVWGGNTTSAVDTVNTCGYRWQH